MSCNFVVHLDLEGVHHHTLSAHRALEPLGSNTIHIPQNYLQKRAELRKSMKAELFIRSNQWDHAIRSKANNI